MCIRDRHHTGNFGVGTSDVFRRRAASPVERSGPWPSRATVTASQAPGGTVDGAHALLETLAAAGVEVCFANPGTTELPLVRALEATPGVRAILGLFEGVCTGAADGYGRMIGRPPRCTRPRTCLLYT